MKPRSIDAALDRAEVLRSRAEGLRVKADRLDDKVTAIEREWTGVAHSDVIDVRDLVRFYRKLSGKSS